MATLALLKNEFTKDEKYHNLMRRLNYEIKKNQMKMETKVVLRWASSCQNLLKTYANNKDTNQSARMISALLFAA